MRTGLKSFVFLVVAFIMANSAFAVSTVYTSLATFLPNLAPGFFFNNFATVLPGAAVSLPFGPVNGFSYTVSTPPGSISGLFNDPGIISTDNAADKILVTFTGAAVTALGGDLYATDINFLPIAANVTIALSDGTVETYASSAANRFRGFTTTGPAITSFTIDAIDPVGSFAWATLDNLYVGTFIPEPSSVALLAIGAIGLLRRR